MVKKFSWLKIALMIGLLTGFTGAVFYWYFHQVQRSSIVIHDFNDERDTQFILDIFKEDWWWLVSEYSKDFSPEYMLQYRASSKKPESKGNLTIKVAYDQHKPIGFVAYYKKEFYYGYILFLDVLASYRSKGIGYALLDYAVQDLKKRGVTKIGLVTRTSNIPARRLYKKYGFKEISDENGFVDFEYQVYA